MASGWKPNPKSALMLSVCFFVYAEKLITVMQDLMSLTCETQILELAKRGLRLLITDLRM